MNNQEAKLILQAYRPGGEDASDPIFAEALEQARRDPELQKWLTEQNVLDARLQTRLEAAVPVPRGLKSDLLALRKISRPEPWWFQPKILAAAATILLLGVAAFILLPQKASPIASFQQAMVNYSTTWKDHVVFQTHDMTKVRQWLQDQGVPAAFELPAALPAGQTHGCRVVDWNGRKATMICFVLDNGNHLDLFVMDATGFPGMPNHDAPEYAEAEGRSTATWEKDGKVYLLIGDDQKSLRQIFQPT